MATFPASFPADSEKVHCEHQALITELGELDAALDELICDSQVFADLAPARKVCACGRHLADTLPEHFRREEAAILNPVARVSPELAEFTQEMRRQHQALRARLADFCRALEALEAAQDLDQAVAYVKQQGKQLAREMSNHIALEENQLGGFL